MTGLLEIHNKYKVYTPQDHNKQVLSSSYLVFKTERLEKKKSCVRPRPKKLVSTLPTGCFFFYYVKKIMNSRMWVGGERISQIGQD